MSEELLDTIAQAMGFLAPFVAVWLTFWWMDRKVRRRR